MHNSNDRSSSSLNARQRKRLGGYLVEAGLLTPAQIDVALNDQKLTGMRFGEILAARGWVKQQTIEYFMSKVVLPEQRVVKQTPPSKDTAKQESPLAQGNGSTSGADQRQPTRRELPISKPLPSVGSSDGDVSWVG